VEGLSRTNPSTTQIINKTHDTLETPGIGVDIILLVKQYVIMVNFASCFEDEFFPLRECCTNEKLMKQLLETLLLLVFAVLSKLI